jgi:hypothetical protein
MFCVGVPLDVVVFGVERVLVNISTLDNERQGKLAVEKEAGALFVARIPDLILVCVEDLGCEGVLVLGRIWLRC